MSGQIVSEGQFLFFCFLSGICITVVYDCFRIFRRVVRHGTFWIAVEDLVFWFGAAVFLFFMLYETNNGVIRWFSIAGAAVGMLIYKYTIGEHLVEIMSTLIKTIQDIVQRVLRFLFRPVKRLINRAFSKWRKLRKKIKKQVKKKLTGDIKKVKIILCKRKDERKQKKLKKKKEQEAKRKKREKEKKEKDKRGNYEP
ncbi:MAG: spore cortex biosynthesis protein YabQ [Lachnospiraceae bacterium]|nr:spore cortex biosynthesis protein YabQ [Lachnospiraceae bacterium]